MKVKQYKQRKARQVWIKEIKAKFIKKSSNDTNR